MAPGDLLVVAVSGGSDSVALLHLLAAISGELDIRLCAVYVNHGLRPEEAAAETELVKMMAGQLGTAFRTATVAVREYGKAAGMSLETAARQLRYEFLERVAEELGAAMTAVAHTAEDQTEEVLLRLLRGAGRNGLSGMKVVNYRRVIRPLLAVGKAQLLDYLRERNIPFLEDSSNAQRDFLRNRVRLDLLPYLEENFNPAIRPTLLRTAEVLGAEDDLLDKLAWALYQQSVSSDGSEIIRVDSKAIIAAHRALGRRVIERLLVDIGDHPSFQQIEKVLALAENGQNGRELHLTQGLRMVKRDGLLEFFYPAGRNRHRASLVASRELFFEKLIVRPGKVFIEELGITLEVEVVEQQSAPAELLRSDADCLDMAELAFPLKVRSPMPGDRFHPLGGPGRRKVADFLGDCKIARENRCRIPVLVGGEAIIALLGLRIEHRFRLTDYTRKVLKITKLPR